jgi:DNA-binding transcriptional LysR family regulator
MLDVTRLRVLVAVARHGSVTAAAHALNYAQPSVSHHLARLEAETGTKLITKAGRGVRLTDAGRLLAERASEIIGRLDAAENELAAYSGLRAGRLRLAAFPSALGTIVPAAAAMLHGKHPSVDLRLTEAEPPEALRMLRAGYVDMALIFRHEPEGHGPPPDTPGTPSAPQAITPTQQGTAPHEATPSQRSTEDQGGVSGQASMGGRRGGVPQVGASGAGGTASHDDTSGQRGLRGEADTGGLREQVLLDEAVFLVMPTGDASLALPDIADGVTEIWPDALARFADHRWIAGCDRCREHLLQQCAAAGYTPKIAFTTDDFVAVQALVTAGLGVALLPGLALRAARNPAVRTLRLRGTRRSVIAVRYGDPPDPPATSLLMEALRAASATIPPPAHPAPTAMPATPDQIVDN